MARLTGKNLTSRPFNRELSSVLFFAHKHSIWALRSSKLTFQQAAQSMLTNFLRQGRWKGQSCESLHRRVKPSQTVWSLFENWGIFLAMLNRWKRIATRQFFSYHVDTLKSVSYFGLYPLSSWTKCLYLVISVNLIFERSVNDCFTIQHMKLCSLTWWNLQLWLSLICCEVLPTLNNLQENVRLQRTNFREYYWHICNGSSNVWLVFAADQRLEIQ